MVHMGRGFNILCYFHKLILLIKSVLLIVTVVL